MPSLGPIWSGDASSYLPNKSPERWVPSTPGLHLPHGRVAWHSQYVWVGEMSKLNDPGLLEGHGAILESNLDQARLLVKVMVNGRD